MNVTKTVSGNHMELVLEGKFDAVSAPKFETEIAEQLDGISDIVIDMGGVEYISSAGLRTLLFLQQALYEVNGKVSVRSVPEIVMNIFEVTGFNDVITIL